MFDAPVERVTELAEKGYTVVQDALSPEQVDRLSAAMDRALERHAGHTREEPAKGRSQLFGIPALDAELIEPLALLTTLPIVCTFLGWNIYMYHSHLDITRPLPPSEESTYQWHRDMQSTTYTLPPPLPLLSVKIGYFLTDVTSPDRGSPMVIPGSHLSNKVERAEDFAQEQPTADPVLAPAGSAMILDSRLWHSVGKNHSDVTRKVLYYAYAYRWIRPSDPLHLSEEQLAVLSPIQRQLLGAGTTVKGFHLPQDEDVPLRSVVQSGSVTPFTIDAPVRPGQSQGTASGSAQKTVVDKDVQTGHVGRRW
jgi:ectoine hydroxylase-related dioxygenase (phytanoyl-CoA dioxygenase family)